MTCSAMLRSMVGSIWGGEKGQRRVAERRSGTVRGR